MITPKIKRKRRGVTPALIRFDWAMKRLLRQKANYTVLEGFLSVLLDEGIKIINIKESESNQTHALGKFNRVDILVENDHGELLIIEIQNSEEVDYFLRMLYGVSKAISEHISTGEPYNKVRKVYHINIVYFKLGQGSDYVYHGITEFRGMHNNDVLQLTEEQKVFFVENNRKNVSEVKDLFAEYYILCVEDFNNVAKDSLDQWIYFFKNNSIPEEFTAAGLKEARERLQYHNLSEQEKLDYDYHLKQKNFERGSMDTATRKGRAQGRAQGRAEGLAEGEEERARLQAEKETAVAEKEAAVAEKEVAVAEKEAAVADIATKMHKEGMPVETISSLTGLSVEEIKNILNLV